MAKQTALITGNWQTPQAAITRPDLRLTITQYWWQEWLPLLGYERWHLVTGLRYLFSLSVGLGIDNPGEITIQGTLPNLAQDLGMTEKTLARLLRNEAVPGQKYRQLALPVAPKGGDEEVRQTELLRLFIPRLGYTSTYREGKTRRTGLSITLVLDELPVPAHLAAISQTAQNPVMGFHGAQNPITGRSTPSHIPTPKNTILPLFDGAQNPIMGFDGAQNPIMEVLDDDDITTTTKLAIEGLISQRGLKITARQVVDLVNLAHDFTAPAQLKGETGLAWVLAALQKVDSEVRQPVRYVRKILAQQASAMPQVTPGDLTAFALATGLPFEVATVAGFIERYARRNVSLQAGQDVVQEILTVPDAELAQEVRRAALALAAWYKNARMQVQLPDDETWAALALLLADTSIPAPARTPENLVAQVFQCAYQQAIPWGIAQYAPAAILEAIAQRIPYHDLMVAFSPQIPAPTHATLRELLLSELEIADIATALQDAQSFALLQSWVAFVGPLLRHTRDPLLDHETPLLLKAALSALVEPPKTSAQHWQPVYPINASVSFAAAWLVVVTQSPAITQRALEQLVATVDEFGPVRVWACLRQQIQPLCNDYRTRAVAIRPADMVQRLREFLVVDVPAPVGAEVAHNKGNGCVPPAITTLFQDTYGREPTAGEAVQLQQAHALCSALPVWQHAFAQAALSGSAEIPPLRYVLTIVKSGDSQARPARAVRVAARKSAGVPVLQLQDMPPAVDENPLPPLN